MEQEAWVTRIATNIILSLISCLCFKSIPLPVDLCNVPTVRMIGRYQAAWSMVSWSISVSFVSVFRRVKTWLHHIIFLPFYHFWTSFIYHLFIEQHVHISSVGTHFYILVNTTSMYIIWVLNASILYFLPSIQC